MRLLYFQVPIIQGSKYCVEYRQLKPIQKLFKRKPKLAIEKMWVALFKDKLLYMSKSGKGDGVTEKIPQEAYDDILRMYYQSNKKNFKHKLINSKQYIYILGWIEKFFFGRLPCKIKVFDEKRRPHTFLVTFSKF